jgi:hypothetical protein
MTKLNLKRILFRTPQNYRYTFYKNNAKSAICVAVRYFDNFSHYKLEKL